MVPRFSGWGTSLFGAVNYWGGIENSPKMLAGYGHTVIVTIGNAPVSCTLSLHLRSIYQ
ncbi:hypothetical protein V1517DRAFT_326066 [Lipomyces orientalis]|uniref:Uncharacterized protein n=1 Tax=Lipomyces orientalis TaxID=1233043 RepID=A0ACC3TKU3_9ASCO